MDVYIDLYIRHQNAIAVAFIVLPVLAVAYKQWKSLDWKNFIAAGGYGTGVQTGILLIFAAGAPEGVERIQFPAQVAIWGALSIIYAWQEFFKLWRMN